MSEDKTKPHRTIDKDGKPVLYLGNVHFSLAPKLLETKKDKE
jgi:hypothetical protein